jgi:hypothetical protein
MSIAKLLKGKPNAPVSPRDAALRILTHLPKSQAVSSARYASRACFAKWCDRTVHLHVNVCILVVFGRCIVANAQYSQYRHGQKAWKRSHHRQQHSLFEI